MDETQMIVKTITDPKATVGIVCILLIGSGILSLRLLKPESPLAPYVLQILGLTFILPVVILITTIIEVDPQAVMGLLGTIVGYIFGTSRGVTPPGNGESAREGLNPSNQIQATPKSGASD
jgi:hypothetical protein